MTQYRTKLTSRTYNLLFFQSHTHSVRMTGAPVYGLWKILIDTYMSLVTDKKVEKSLGHLASETKKNAQDIQLLIATEL